MSYFFTVLHNINKYYTISLFRAHPTSPRPTYNPHPKFWGSWHPQIPELTAMRPVVGPISVEQKIL